MIETTIESCKNRIDDLLCAKIALVQIIADYEYSSDNNMKNDKEKEDNKQIDDDYIRAIEWKIEIINSEIVKIRHYMYCLEVDK